MHGWVRAGRNINGGADGRPRFSRMVDGFARNLPGTLADFLGRRCGALRLARRKFGFLSRMVVASVSDRLQRTDSALTGLGNQTVAIRPRYDGRCTDGIGSRLLMRRQPKKTKTGCSPSRDFVDLADATEGRLRDYQRRALWAVVSCPRALLRGAGGPNGWLACRSSPRLSSSRREGSAGVSKAFLLCSPFGTPPRATQLRRRFADLARGRIRLDARDIRLSPWRGAPTSARGISR
jgi:hypothetical protein